MSRSWLIRLAHVSTSTHSTSCAACSLQASTVRLSECSSPQRTHARPSSWASVRLAGRSMALLENGLGRVPDGDGSVIVGVQGNLPCRASGRIAAGTYRHHPSRCAPRDMGGPQAAPTIADFCNQVRGLESARDSRRAQLIEVRQTAVLSSADRAQRVFTIAS